MTTKCISRVSLMAIAALLTASAGADFIAPARAGGQVEVMHYWTSGGEANALNVIKEALEREGISWKDSAVAGGSGTNAYQVLQARIAAGDPPAAMQMHGQQIRAYASEEMLGDLNDLAAQQKWDEVISPELQAFAKFNGVYVGVPINMHRHNWVWASKKLIDQYGGKLPGDWPEFLAMAEKMKADGVLPLALGGQPWQEFMLWEDIVVGVGGKQLHKAALEDLDESAITGDKMLAVFDTFRKVLSYADPNNANRDWNLATAMVTNDQAAMHFMGDWALGEFSVAGKKADVDYLCAPAPGTAGTYIFLADYWGFFEVKGDTQALQKRMAEITMEPKIQEAFNIRKGSIPARLDVTGDAFDACGKKAITDRKEAMAGGAMLPSLSQNHAQPREIRGVFEDVITEFASSPSMSSADAVRKIAAGIKAL